MKKIIMITTSNCAYCKKAKSLLSRIYIKSPQYSSVKVEIIDILEATKRNMQYNIIPSFFIDNERVFEGYLTIEKLAEILEAAYTDNTIAFCVNTTGYYDGKHQEQ